MSEDYKKYNVEMNFENDAYRYFRIKEEKPVCFVERYKGKRSVYFSITNLLPSNILKTGENREYHIVLIGTWDGEIIHRDFGELFINQKGEGTLFKKFSGPPIESYTHCLVVAADEEGKANTVISGQIIPSEISGTTKQNEPYAEPERKKENRWQMFIDETEGKESTEIFTEKINETKAAWVRTEAVNELSELISECGDMANKYGHYIIGKSGDKLFLGIPGRFLKAEQPLKNKGIFALWQPIKGGEKFLHDIVTENSTADREVFGYWIAEIDVENKKLKQV